MHASLLSFTSLLTNIACVGFKLLRCTKWEDRCHLCELDALADEGDPPVFLAVDDEGQTGPEDSHGVEEG